MKQIIPEKSSEKVAKFLKKNSLHKKDFAEMIGVTLSYVYNLIDAFTAKGARRVVVRRGRTSLQAAPYIDQKSFGMGLTYKF